MTAPRAAASVGVAIPKNMLPRTATIMDNIGRAYFAVSMIFFDSDVRSTT